MGFDDDRAKRVIEDVQSAKALFAPAFARASDERLYIAYLDGRDQLIGLRVRYGIDRATVEMPVRAIIEDAVSLAGRALILAHNHPSGEAEPSPIDIQLTRALVQVARPLGIALRDHLIFAGEAVYSFREGGLL